jgi:alkylhydroperoxidase/carboxymuconolactone decarboxylase family protein YurZ
MTTDTAPESALGRIAQGDAPVLEQVFRMNLDSLAASGLDEKTYFMVRLAALVALDAAPASYVINLGLARDAGVTLEEVQSMLIAIAPAVGSARVTAAAGKILRGLFGVEVFEEAAGIPEQRSSETPA